MHGLRAMLPHGDFARCALYNLTMGLVGVLFGGCLFWFGTAREPIR